MGLLSDIAMNDTSSPTIKHRRKKYKQTINVNHEVLSDWIAAYVCLKKFKKDTVDLCLKKLKKDTVDLEIFA